MIKPENNSIKGYGHAGILIYLLLFCFPLYAADLYVSPKGNDRNAGSIEFPFASLPVALRQAREIRRQHSGDMNETIRIIMREGSYSLCEPVFIRPEDGGTINSPTIIEGESEKDVTISGGIVIDNWKKAGKLWVADVPEFNGRPIEFRQMWIDGKKAVRARDVDDFEKMYRIRSNDTENQRIWVPAAAVKPILKAPRAEMVLHQMWAVSFLRIKAIEVAGDSAAIYFHQPESRIQFERPWPRPMIAPGKNSAFYLTNALDLLDTPGEWFLDIDKRKVYYYPKKSETLSGFKTEVPVLENLIRMEGTADRPVQNVHFRNLQFAHTGWLRPSFYGHVPLQAGMYLTDGYKLRPQQIRPDNHKLDNQGWLGRPATAVSVSNASFIRFEDCRFEHLGSTGLDLISGVQQTTVSNCIFEDIAGNGLLAGSFSPASHETHLPYNPQDQRELCAYLDISNNLFRDVTNEDWGCVAIGAGYVHDVKITHNEISEVSYTGISVGWGWNRDLNCMKNNVIANNLIYHYGKHMYDVAGIYTLGAQPGTIITENYVHSIYTPGYVHDPNHWFYLYTDEGSSFIRVINNKTEGEKFLQNANGPGNIWENNGPQVNDSVAVKAGITL